MKRGRYPPHPPRTGRFRCAWIIRDPPGFSTEYMKLRPCRMGGCHPASCDQGPPFPPPAVFPEVGGRYPHPPFSYVSNRQDPGGMTRDFAGACRWSILLPPYSAISKNGLTGHAGEGEVPPTPPHSNRGITPRPRIFRAGGRRYPPAGSGQVKQNPNRPACYDCSRMP